MNDFLFHGWQRSTASDTPFGLVSVLFSDEHFELEKRNILNFVINKMKDYFCAYHNTQFITNFCRCSQCLLPVCPTCIRLHSEEHSLLKT